jgi:hypothetical protein
MSNPEFPSMTENTHVDRTEVTSSKPPDSVSFLPDIWYLMASRIAPPLCCIHPPPLHAAFRAAIREVLKKDGDLDLAVRYLHDIIIEAPPESMVFQQAGQLLNIIEWRRLYHPEWFVSSVRGHRLKPGACGPYVARAMALLESGADDQALILTEKIIKLGDTASDDIQIAHLIRAAVFICSGDIITGEEEFLNVYERV